MDHNETSHDQEKHSGDHDTNGETHVENISDKPDTYEISRRSTLKKGALTSSAIVSGVGTSRTVFAADGNDFVYGAPADHVDKIFADGTVERVTGLPKVPKGITAASDGTFWMTNQEGVDEPGYVRQVDRKGEVVQKFPEPDEQERGIVIDDQGLLGERGLLYMVGGRNAAVYKFNQSGDVLKQYSLPDIYIGGIAIGEEENILWLSNDQDRSNGGQVVYKTDISGGSLTVVDSWEAQTSEPRSVRDIAVVGSEIWSSSDKNNTNDIFRLNKETGNLISKIQGVGGYRGLTSPSVEATQDDFISGTVTDIFGTPLSTTISVYHKNGEIEPPTLISQTKSTADSDGRFVFRDFPQAKFKSLKKGIQVKYELL